MKNIMFIITKSENGGAQKWTKEQIEILENYNTFLVTNVEGWLTKSSTVCDILIDINIEKRISVKFFYKLLIFVKKNKINLVIASSANAGIYARLLKIFLKDLKVIYVSHGWSSIYNGGRLKNIYNFIERKLSILSDSILCISNKDYLNAEKIIKINKNKLKLITNKINPICNTKKCKNKKIKILTVSRLVPPKRIDLIIKSIQNFDLELHIVGDGYLRKTLESNEHKNIFFHGEINGFNDFSSYDIFILISESEGLPLSALEAMSVGLPVIISDVGGCSELIDNNGILVQNNIESINNAIKVCIENYNDFSSNSKKIFDCKFNLKKNKNEYIDYYERILRN